MTKADLAIAQIIIGIIISATTLVIGFFMYQRGMRTRDVKLRVKAYVLWAVGGLLTGVLFFPALAYLYTEHLWFESVGYDNIFLKNLKTRWALHFKFLLLEVGFMGLNLFLGDRLCPVSREVARWTRQRTNHFYYTMFIVIIFMAFLLAVPMMFLWDDFIRYDNYESPENAEPMFFGKELGFFLFSFPVYRWVSFWLKVLLWATVLIVAIQYNFYYRRDPQTMARVKHYLIFHGSILWLMLLGISLCRSQINIWNVLYTSRTPWGFGYIDGIGYVDDILIRTYKIYMFSCALIGVALLINVFWRKRMVWYSAVAVWGLSYLVLIQVYPLFVHVTAVAPNQGSKEEDFIRTHIASTRQAFELDQIKKLDTIRGDATLEIINRNRDVRQNIQLWDRNVLYKVLQEKKREGKDYYEFHPYTDVDRYKINGKYRQVLIAAREVNPENLTQKIPNTQKRDGQNIREADDRKLMSKWEVKLRHTHGYGVCVVPVNEFDGSDPNFWVEGIPVKSRYDELKVKQPRIYYGELTKKYAIINTATNMEVDPEDQQYNGTGGVEIGGWFRRLCFAMRFNWRVLFSSDLTPESKFLYWRKIGTRKGPSFPKTVTDRLSHIAPFLKYDPDPYIVIGDDGQLWWIIDTYVTSRWYPNARGYTDDTKLIENLLYSEPVFDRFNYIRNPAVAVVNAYTGEVGFYLTKDDKEPIIHAYKKAFPIFKSRKNLPQGLENHLRYPDYLTRIQSEIYTHYHVENPKKFYDKEDRWKIPKEIYYSTRQTMVPYYATIKLPGEEDLEFVNIIPFTPHTQETLMKAWLVARCDSENYGQLLVFELPSDVTGPEEVEISIETKLIEKQVFSPTLATNIQNRSNTVIRGNLLVIPVEDTLFYVEPIYQKSKDQPLPNLATVVVVAGNRPAVAAETFDKALEEIFGIGISVEELEGDTENGAEPAIPMLDELTKLANERYNQYFQLTGEGKFAEAAEAFTKLGDILKALAAGKYQKEGEKTSNIKREIDYNSIVTRSIKE
ncbi:MAG: UPF0182 family protein [Ignavibacteria bacterium]|nr:UPF0182 family protein [Ignavibacteria bacterium]